MPGQWCKLPESPLPIPGDVWQCPICLRWWHGFMIDGESRWVSLQSGRSMNPYQLTGVQPVELIVR